ncbi:MAG: penicillin-binding protein 2 [Rhodobacteraceae bacterium]|nr:penicillin-binding protein 2 [Paracoccaceae bacterium]
MSRLEKMSSNSARKLSRRVLLLGAAQLIIAGVIGRRIVYLQAIDQKYYTDQAEANRISYGLILPERGLIVDRNGVVLAKNIQEYWASLIPEEANNVQQTLANFSQIIHLSEEDTNGILQKVRSNLPFIPVLLADKLSWKQVAEISVNGPALGGVNVEFANQRYYPLGKIFSHIIGYVGLVSQQELSTNQEAKALYVHPKFKIGKTGIEKSLEGELRGQPGHVKYEVNVHGRKIRELDIQPNEAGQNIQLTLDHTLQEYTFSRLGTEVGSAIIMDLEKGDILALVSTPSFNPNLFVQGITQDEYRNYLNHEHYPLFDRASGGQYPPGSIFKMITALAGLHAGVITPEETVFCNGSFDFYDKKIFCWKKQGHGVTNLHKSISESCDVYYYELALQVGIKQIAAMAERFGLGQTFDLPLPNVSPGLVPNQDWKFSRTGERWVAGDTINASIGQGFVLSSVLQLGVMVARLVSGLKINPRLIRSLGGNDLPAPDWEPIGLNQSHLKLVTDGFDSAVNDKLGTAFRSRIIDPNFRIAGKTATSQVKRIDTQLREQGLQNENIPRESRDHSLFVGFGPVEEPKYVAAVIIEHGGSGSRVAAPIARDLLAFTHYGGMPSIDAYPSDVRSEVIELRKNMDIRRQQEPSDERPNV